MNKDVNRPKAGIITIIDSPGGRDELIIYLVEPETFYKALDILENSFDTITNRADIGKLSNDILDLLFENDEFSDGVIKHDVTMSWGYYDVGYLNTYEIIGMVPIQTY